MVSRDGDSEALAAVWCGFAAEFAEGTAVARCGSSKARGGGVQAGVGYSGTHARGDARGGNTRVRTSRGGTRRRPATRLQWPDLWKKRRYGSFWWPEDG